MAITEKEYRFNATEVAKLARDKARLWAALLALCVALLVVVIFIARSVSGMRTEMANVADIVMFSAASDMPLEELALERVREFAQLVVGHLGTVNAQTVDQVVSDIRGRMVSEAKGNFDIRLAPDIERIKQGDLTVSTIGPVARYTARINRIGEPVWKVIVRAYQEFAVLDMPRKSRQIDVELLITRMPFAGTFRPGIQDIKWPPLYTEKGEIVDVLINDDEVR